MKKTFLRILPVVAAVLLATSCSKEDNGDVNSVDTPQTTEVPDPTPEQPAEQSKTVKVPFSVKVDGGESLSKITYALKKDDKDNDIWNKVLRTFDDDDLPKGKHPISLTVKGAAEGSGITESTIPLTKGTDGKFYFEGDIEVASDKVAEFKAEGEDDKGIALVGEFTVDGTPLPTSSAVSLAALMTSCAHTYKTKDGEFTSKSSSVMLYDQNVYLAVQMSRLQHTLDVKVSGNALSECNLSNDGQVWIALEGGKSVSTNFLTKTAEDVVAGHIYTIDRSGFVDLGIPGILWADHNIGGTNPEDYGNYYAWGETAEKEQYAWATYKYAEGSENTLTKYCYNSDYGYGNFTDELSVLGKYEQVDDDVAHVANNKWSMPTHDDFIALKKNCVWEKADEYESLKNLGEGKYAGYIFYKKNNDEGHSYDYKKDTHIFLPAAGYYDDVRFQADGSAGYYWSSSLYMVTTPNFAYFLSLSSTYVNEYTVRVRYAGQSVRAVRK